MQRRFPRLSLTAEQFKLDENDKVYAVSDLSKAGMGLRILDKDDLALFPLMREIEGSLKIQDEKFQIKARVRNVRRDSVGLEFHDLSKTAQESIAKFLDPLRLGPDLKVVPLENDGTAWYHGATGTDILVWKTPSGELDRFGVYIFGTFVHWEGAGGLSTGRIAAAADADTVDDGVIRLETMILDPDPRPDRDKVNVAKDLILSSNLAKELQNDLALKLAGAKNGT